MRGRRAGVLTSGAAAMTVIALTTAALPTQAVWEDRGGSTLTVTAIAEAPVDNTAPIVGTTAQTTVMSATAVATGPEMTGEPTAQSFCVTEDVFTTSPTRAPWSITFRTKGPPFNGVSKNNIWPWRTSYNIVEAADYATSGELIVTPTSSDQWASVTEPHVFRFCTYTPEPEWLPPGPTTYSVTSLTLTVENGNPCVTAVTTSVPRYYIGFTATFDLKALLDRELLAGRIDQAQYDRFLQSRYWESAAGGARGATGSDYSVTFTGYDVTKRTIRQTIPVALTSCSW